VTVKFRNNTGQIGKGRH